MWFGLAKIAISTGAKLYSNKKKTEEAMSNAALMNAEKMARGEMEYSGKLLDHQKSDWKDEFCLATTSYNQHRFFYLTITSAMTIPEACLSNG